MAALTGGKPSRTLLISNNGGGKTGALASLAEAGYNLRIADADNGTEILHHLLKSNPAAFARVDVETHTDTYIERGGAAVVQEPLRCFSGIAKVLTNWPGLGKPTEWTRDDILVLDSLTFTGRGIMNHVLKANARLNTHPQLQDWDNAQILQENLVAMLCSEAIPCHVIVTAHITYVQAEGELVAQAYPSALGRKLPPRIGGYFNMMLSMSRKGNGAAAQYFVNTLPTSAINCKTPAPGLLKAEYPIKTGMADIFRALYGPGPAEK